MRLHEVEFLQIKDEGARARRLVELNVIEQVRNLYKTFIIPAAMKSENTPQLHGLVYDNGEGILIDLNWKDDDLKRFKHIFNIAPKPAESPA